jgi:glycosyltransferase involved in cell wall biosynthesis
MNGKPYNILFITHYAGMYGANKSMCSLILDLKENYSVNPLVLMRSEGPICDILQTNNIPYIVSHFFWWVYEGKGLRKSLLNFVKQIRNLSKVNKIINLLKNHQIDLVYTNSITINIGISLSKKIGCPHIWHIRETPQAYGFKFSLGKKISKSILQEGADRYVVISEYMKDWYSSMLPAHKVIRIYNGVDPQLPLRGKNMVNSTFNLCMLGILCDQKNQMEALKALDMLVNIKGIKTLRLHLIGGKREEYYLLLNKYIIEKQLENYVVFHGHCNEVNILLNEMNLGIACARDEGFGRASVEFMLNRMPVIASISGANAEIIQDGFNGDIYPLGSYNMLAKKMEQYIINSYLLDLIGENSQNYALKEFSAKKNTHLIFNLFNNVIKENLRMGKLIDKPNLYKTIKTCTKNLFN